MTFHEPVVACVVLNWKDTRRTLRCIDSLVSSELVAQVIVVDNESDGTLAAEIERRDLAKVHVIEQSENRGFAGGVNPGLKFALDGPAEAVLCINNDAYLAAGSLGFTARGP